MNSISLLRRTLAVGLVCGFLAPGHAADECTTYSPKVHQAIKAYTASLRGAENCEALFDAKGDVDQDGTPDLLVAFTVEGACSDPEEAEDRPGTCGNNYEIYLMAFKGGQQQASEPLRIGGKGWQLPEAMTLTHGLIQVASLKYAESDALCCPTVATRDFYRLEGRKLVAVQNSSPPVAPSPPAQPGPTTGGRITVDGTGVAYQSVPEVKAGTVAFQMESKGYRNIYLLDCLDRTYIWAKNIDLRTNQETTNTAGAEWKMMNEKSTITNAVYEAICPQLLGSKPAVSVTAASANSQFELEFWSSVKNSDDVGDFQAYLDKYPQGQFQALARRRIDRLKETVQDKPTAIAAHGDSPTRTVEGTLTAYECGDNCYLTITDLQGQEQTGLCEASICELWGDDESSFSRYQGKKVRITVGKGQRFDGEGEVVDEMDEFVKIEAL